MPRPTRLELTLLATLLLCAAASRADGPLRYQCSTVMNYGPGPCKGSVAPVRDETTLEIDLDHRLWRSGRNSGPLESGGGTLTLKQWGLRPGRDASLDRGSGAFSYHFESGCLVQHQTGSCEPQPR